MKQFRLFMYALDPTHIGAGGYRLGRVDNTIMRDAGTNLPKIPGSSISGVTRAAAIYSLKNEIDRKKAMAYASYTLDPKNKPRPDHRGQIDPIAKLFGFAEGDEDGTAQIGQISFRDAEILAFPVSTLSGPRWVTTARLLKLAGCENFPEVSEINKILVQSTAKSYPRLNLGWMLLDTEKANIPLPDGVTANIKNNLVLVHEDLFPSIVNANLETRTSVSIDFKTGAGAKGALFTYEATPRGTLYLGQVDFDNDRFRDHYENAFKVVKKALNLAFKLGIGGMTTRGFGRMKENLVEIEIC